MKERCEVCEKKRPTEQIDTKHHGLLDVCKRCADWATANFFVKK